MWLSPTRGRWRGCNRDATRRGRHCPATSCTLPDRRAGRRRSRRPTNETRRGASSNRPALRGRPSLLAPPASSSLRTRSWSRRRRQSPTPSGTASCACLLVAGVRDLDLQVLRLHVEEHLLRIAGSIWKQGKGHRERHGIVFGLLDI